MVPPSISSAAATETKSTRAHSTTTSSQGGLAPVMPAEDNFDNHVRDTLVAGDGLCNEAAVHAIVSDAPARVRELVAIALEFSRDASGQFELGREGGHSHRRILHVKDMTGKAIEEALLRAVAESKHIDLFEHLFAIADDSGEPFDLGLRELQLRFKVRDLLVASLGGH